MATLVDKIEQLREDGIGLSLTDTEIDNCILDTLKYYNVVSQVKKNHGKAKDHEPGRGEAVASKPKPNKRNFLQRSCRCMMWTVLGFLVLLMFFSMAFSLLGMVPSVEKRVSKILAPHAHSIFRYWRLATLPITRTFDVTDLYTSECIVTNPFHQIPPIPCEQCKSIERIHTRKMIKAEKFEEDFYGQIQPLLLRNEESSLIFFEDLQIIYGGNEHYFRTESNLKTTSQDIKTLDDLFTKYTAQSLASLNTFHAEWVSPNVNPSRLLRKFFPRPKALPSESEVNILKTVFIDAPGAKPYTWAKINMPNLWYVQGSGSRELFLIPQRHCVQECANLRIRLKAGDTLFVNEQFWRVDSVAVSGSDDLSVAFIGSFS